MVTMRNIHYLSNHFPFKPITEKCKKNNTFYIAAMFYRIGARKNIYFILFSLEMINKSILCGKVSG